MGKFILFVIIFLIIITSNYCIELKPNHMCLKRGKKCDSHFFLPQGLKHVTIKKCFVSCG